MMIINSSNNKMESSTICPPLGLCQGRSSSSLSAAATVSSATHHQQQQQQYHQGKESIHSGQFMVSHFEAEEQDDDDEDTEIKMPDPDDPNYQKPEDLNLCTEIQLYVPQKLYQSYADGDCSTTVTSHLEIETSLTKLFKCMNLAYRQKLTSPKWNHFKGVRLRWKDKIRLNNVIWRCWHMQFILKKRTPVCQFASPLDVDVHSNPQSVVLEGKYWKRQLSVIKAEYRKWRRNSKTKAIGYCFDTKSEFDFLEWSPLSNDRSLMITDDWTSDTLFSAINVPFPFPDPREIARGAGIADFIQPSLGPLQPNLDDIDITFQELLQSTRLPPVPEEGTDDILKSVDYNFSAIMGSEQLDSVNIMDVTNASQTQQNAIQSTIEDENMVDLVALNRMQSYVSTSSSAAAATATEKMCSENMEIQQTSDDGGGGDVVLQELSSVNSNTLDILDYSGINETSTDAVTTYQQFAAAASNQIVDLQTSGGSVSCSSSQLNSIGKNNVLKGRVSKTLNRSFRKREPHNYDKAQPTLHQTNIYQQMLAEQQQQQQKQQQFQLSNITSNMQFCAATSATTSNRQFISSSNATSTTNLSDIFPMQSINNNNSSNNNCSLNLPSSQNSSAAAALLRNHQKALSISSEILSILNATDNSTVQDLYKVAAIQQHQQQLPNNQNSTSNTAAIAAAYKSFAVAANAQQQNLNKIPPQTSLEGGGGAGGSGGFLSISPSGCNIAQQQTSISGNKSNDYLIDQQQQQHLDLLSPAAAKEMYRSNSLPLNASLQKFELGIKDEMFLVPKFHHHHHHTNTITKNHQRSRTRSSSTTTATATGGSGHQSLTSNFSSVPSLQTATSEPLLNSTLAQLLTTNSSNKLSVKQCSAPATLSQQNAIRMPFSAPSTVISYQKQQQPSLSSSQQQQQQQLIPLSQLSLSPRSSSLPQPATLHSPPTTTAKIMSFPPCLSPADSFIDESPLSPTKCNSSGGGNIKYMKDSQRRVGHIHAEQKRRYNIKNGFDMLHSLIPQLQQNPNAKLSKAAMLQKGAEYIKQLRIERNVINEKMDELRKERDNLNASLSHLHSILPANGAPVSRQRTERVKQLYSQYVRYRTMQNWKFWILGLILEPLLNSYTTTVSMASVEELYRTALLWVDQHCSLVELRPAVSNKLRYLSMTTDILSDPPSTLQEEVLKAINNSDDQHPNLNST